MDGPETLWTWAEIASLFPDTLPEGQAPPNITGVSIDSRSLVPGDLFVALRGERDGHDFIPAAVSAGAVAALAKPGATAACPLLAAPDTLAGLQRLGEAARQRMPGKRVALTGSAGKTTLRHWLETLLGSLGATHASTGSFNNHIGVPLSLARMPGDTQYGVFEIGTNHPGEIAPLSIQVAPDAALLLNVLPVHIGNFSSMEDLLEEKLSIHQGLGEGGVLVLPADLRQQLADYAGAALTFGLGGDVSGTAEATERGMTVSADVCGTSLQLDLPFAGEHRLQTALATLAVIQAIAPEHLGKIAPMFSQLILPAGRGQVLQVADITIVDDSYNANPISTKLAIESLLGRGGGRNILLLGEMLELGDAATDAHEEVARAASAADEAITFGDLYENINLANRVAHYQTVADLPLADFVGSLEPGDKILVKGSNKVFWTNNFVQQLQAAVAKLR